MPEFLRDSYKKFSKGAVSELGSKRFLWEGDIKKLAEINGLQHIGNGAESMVIAPDKTSKNIVSFFYDRNMTPKEVKEIYYLQKIYRTLFPHNFPNFPAVFSGKKEEDILPGIFRERIIEASIPKRYPFEKVRIELDYMGTAEYTSFSEIGFNFITAPDGGEYFVDRSYVRDTTWSKEKFINYMKTHPNQDGRRYSRMEISIVENSINRLAALGIIILTA